MSDISSGGANTSGAGGANTTDASGVNDGTSSGAGGASEDVVAYETHRKLLSEKKRLQEQFETMKSQLSKIEIERQEAERKKLEEQGEYKKLLDLERSRAAKLDEELKTHTEHMRAAKKLDAVLKSVNGNIPNKYWGLIDTASVAIDPDTGEIDAMSVQKAVENLRKDFPEIIYAKTGSTGTPNTAPRTDTAATLSYDQWLKLSSAKEMREKWSQVDPRTMPT